MGPRLPFRSPAGMEKLGWLCSMDTGVQPVKDKDGNVIENDLKTYKGICLWVKGDGSDATAVFSTNWDFSDHQFRVPMKDTNWHKVFMPWDKWSPKPITDYWYYLTYSIERKDASKANWYIVDRVHLYKDGKTEEIKPTADVDPPGLLPAQAFVSDKDKIAKTLAKLKGRSLHHRDCRRLDCGLRSAFLRAKGLHGSRVRRPQVWLLVSPGPAAQGRLRLPLGQQRLQDLH